MLLSYVEEASPGIHRYRLNLRDLYPNPTVRAQFEQRWHAFAACTPDHNDLFSLDGDSLVYPTESFLPQRTDRRPPVLLILGNPASQSVRSGMCFAFERGSRGEHRFWRALRVAEFLSFNDTDRIADAGAMTRNARRRAQLLSGAYDSPFLIGIDVFFTFPSPASAPRWSGVAGLATLFGRPALRVIAEAERARLADTISGYMPRDKGAVVAFQRDAYEGLRDVTARPYTSLEARAGTLSSASAAGRPVRLFGSPPTRLAHTHAFQEVLRRYAQEIKASVPEPAL